MPKNYRAADRFFHRLALRALGAPVVEGARGHRVHELGPVSVTYMWPPLPLARRVSVALAQQEVAWMLDASGTGIGTADRSARVDSRVAKIWADWDTPHGMGPIYGVQWRKWLAPDGSHIDQIARLLHGLKTDPLSRRHVVAGWSPAEVDDMALPPCLTQYVFSAVRRTPDDINLNMTVLARSSDIVCGLPMDLLEAYMLLHLVCAATGRGSGIMPGVVMFSTANAHLYEGHEEVMEAYLDPPLITEVQPPSLRFVGSTRIRALGHLDDVQANEFKVTGYDAPVIHADVVV